MFANCTIDSNCIQIRAPRDRDGMNVGDFHPDEHIGHLTREFSSKIAPILDQYANSHIDVTFNIHLNYSDTNHTKAGYEIDVVVMSNCSFEFNEHLKQQLVSANLHPRIF